MSQIKKVKLGRIAEIINGLPDPRQPESDGRIDYIKYKYIQPNHLGVFNDIQGFSEIRRISPIDDNYILRENDILIKRLNPDHVTLVSSDLPATTFSNNLFVIRVLGGHVPAYIACVLESQGIAWLSGNIVGSVSAIKSISAKGLAALTIPAVSYQKQTAIGRLWRLAKRRRQLLTGMIAEDQRLLAAVINNLQDQIEEEK